MSHQDMTGSELQDHVLRALTSGDEGTLGRVLDECGAFRVQLCLDGEPSVFPRLCSKGFHGAAGYLLRQCSVDLTATYDGRTALQWACQEGHVHIVQLLLQSPDRQVALSCPPGDQHSEFFSAARGGHVQIVEILHTRFPEALMADNVAQTLLYAACLGGHVDMVRHFLLPAVDVNRAVGPGSSCPDPDRSTPLFAACQGGHIDVAVLLVEHFDAELTEAVTRHFPEFTARVVDLVFRPWSSKGKEVKYSLRGRCLPAVPAAWLQPHLASLTDLDVSRNPLASLTHLDVSHNHLPALDPALPWALRHLRHLDVSHNKLVALCGPDRAPDILCHRLETVNASHNELRDVSVGLFQLPGLSHLNLSHNALQRTCLSPFSDSDTEWPTWSCPKLTELDLSHNALEALPGDDLKQCPALTKLTVSHNNLVALPPPWPCRLKYLDASSNQLESFPVAAEQFWSGSLTTLLLSNNRLVYLDENVFQLGTLQRLKAAHNEIHYLAPPDTWDCPALQELDLSDNRLGVAKGLEFPPSLLSESLVSLSLAGNDLGSLPVSVGYIKNLACLDISNNPMTELPLELGYLRECWNLKAENVKLKNPQHRDMVKSGQSEKVIESLRNQLLNMQPCHTLKVVVIGPQGKGKSTVVEALDRASPSNVKISDQPVTVTTTVLKPPGEIKIEKRPKSDRPTVVLRVWELAGTPELLAFHPVLWTQHSLFLLVWDMTESSAGLCHWLSDIKSRLPKAHVILVATFQDRLPKAERTQRVRQFHVDVNATYGCSEGDAAQYPKDTQHDIFPRLSAVVFLTRRMHKQDVLGLKGAVYEAALRMVVKSLNQPAQFVVGRLLPQVYYDLDRTLLGLGRQRRDGGHSPPYLTREEVYSLCTGLRGPGCQDVKEFDEALAACVQLGSVLHFDVWAENLRGLYFLDPAWLTSMTVAVLRPSSVTAPYRQDRGAVLTRLTESGYPPPVVLSFLQLLKHYNIGAVHQDSLLLPCLLPKMAPGVQLHRSECGRTLHRFYVMPHVPRRLWSRLILGLLLSGDRFSQSCWQGFKMDQLQLTYWQEGINMKYSGGSIVIESAVFRSTSASASPPTPPPREYPGILISILTETSTLADLAVIGFVTDEIVSALQDVFQHYTDNADVFGVFALCPHCLHVKPGQGVVAGDRLHFGLAHCAGSVLRGDVATCDKGHRVPLGDLIPEFLMGDLDEKLHVDVKDLQLLESLAEGAVGVVHKGTLRGKEVAVKLFLKDASSASSETRRQRTVTSDGHAQMTSEGQGMMTSGGHHRATSDGHAHMTSGGQGLMTSGGHRTVTSDGHDPMTSGGQVMMTSGGHRTAASDSGTSTMSSVASGQLSALNYSAGGAPMIGADSGVSLSGTFNRLSREERRKKDRLESRNMQVCRAFTELRQEIVILNQLRHPCLVSLLGVSVRPSLLVVLEFAPHGSLRAVLKEQAKNRTFNRFHRGDKDKTFGPVLGKDLTFKTVHQVALGLEYLHSRRIIYRDLKCDNILVTSLALHDAVNVKISDYGISRFSTSQGMTGKVGTWGYMAPEVMDGHAYDEKVDVFSFSMVIYEVLTGRPPFQKYDKLHQLHRLVIAEKRRPSLAEYNVVSRFPRLEALMRRMWRHAPGERPSSREVVREVEGAGFPLHHAVLLTPSLPTAPRKQPPVAASQRFRNVTCVWSSEEGGQAGGSAGADTVLVWESPGGQQKDRRLTVHHVTSDEPHTSTCKSCPGRLVTCMAQVAAHLWVGVQGACIEVYEVEVLITGEPIMASPGGGRLSTTASDTDLQRRESVSAFSAELADDSFLDLASDPMAMVYDSDNPAKKKFSAGSKGFVYVGLWDGTLLILRHDPAARDPPRPTPIPLRQQWTRHKLLTLALTAAPLTALCLVPARRELVVGCGPHSVVIVSTATLLVERRVCLLHALPACVRQEEEEEEAARCGAEPLTRAEERRSAEGFTRDDVRPRAEALTRNETRPRAEALTRDEARRSAEALTRNEARRRAEAFKREEFRRSAEALTRGEEDARWCLTRDEDTLWCSFPRSPLVVQLEISSWRVSGAYVIEGDAPDVCLSVVSLEEAARGGEEVGTCPDCEGASSKAVYHPVLPEKSPSFVSLPMSPEQSTSLLAPFPISPRASSSFLASSPTSSRGLSFRAPSPGSPRRSSSFLLPPAAPRGSSRVSALPTSPEDSFARTARSMSIRVSSSLASAPLSPKGPSYLASPPMKPKRSFSFASLAMSPISSFLAPAPASPTMTFADGRHGGREMVPRLTDADTRPSRLGTSRSTGDFVGYSARGEECDEGGENDDVFEAIDEDDTRPPPRLHVQSLLVVKDTLWVGSSSGEVLVVAVTKAASRSSPAGGHDLGVTASQDLEIPVEVVTKTTSRPSPAGGHDLGVTASQDLEIPVEVVTKTAPRPSPAGGHDLGVTASQELGPSSSQSSAGRPSAEKELDTSTIGVQKFPRQSSPDKELGPTSTCGLNAPGGTSSVIPIESQLHPRTSLDVGSASMCVLTSPTPTTEPPQESSDHDSSSGYPGSSAGKSPKDTDFESSSFYFVNSGRQSWDESDPLGGHGSRGVSTLALTSGCVVSVRGVAPGGRGDEGDRFAHLDVWEACSARRLSTLGHYWRAVRQLQGHTDSEESKS